MKRREVQHVAEAVLGAYIGRLHRPWQKVDPYVIAGAAIRQAEAFIDLMDTTYPRRKADAATGDDAPENG